MEVNNKCECQSLKNYDNCEDDIDKLNPELKVLIDKIAKREGLTVFKLIVKNITPDGNNYLGVLTQVTVQDTSNNKHLNLFVKSILPCIEHITMISVSEAYHMEVFLYTELSKIYEQLQADAQIPLEERYKFVRCYPESTVDHIIMENMIKNGFTIWNRFDVISLEFAEKAIKLLAKFHSLSFVLQQKQPKYFAMKILPLKHPVQYNDEYSTFFSKMANNALEYLEGSARSKFENAITSLYNKSEDYIKDRDSTMTLCHGDFRSSNILINVAEGEIKDMVPVDFQIISYSSPLIDLIYFIFGATDREFRRKHLGYLKNLYYDTMKQFLKYFDIDIQKYYPKEEYEKLLKERMDYGLFIGIWYLPLNLSQEDNIVDLSKSKISDANYGTNNLTKARIQELVDEFIEWGYL